MRPTNDPEARSPRKLPGRSRPAANRQHAPASAVPAGPAPPRVGHAVMHLAVLDGTGKIQAVPEVRVTMSLPSQNVGPIPVDVGKGEGGHYAAVVPLSLPGRWEISVTVRTSDVDETTVSVPLDVPR